MNNKTFTFEVDRNLLFLFEYITTIKTHLYLPKKYMKLLNNIELLLEKDLYKEPNFDISGYGLADTKINFINIYEKE